MRPPEYLSVITARSSTPVSSSVPEAWTHVGLSPPNIMVAKLTVYTPTSSTLPPPSERSIRRPLDRSVGRRKEKFARTNLTSPIRPSLIRRLSSKQAGKNLIHVASIRNNFFSLALRISSPV